MFTGLMLAVLLAAAPVSGPANPGGVRSRPGPGPTGPTVAAPRGACVAPSGKCKLTSARQCRQLGGQFLGPGTQCRSTTDRPAIC